MPRRGAGLLLAVLASCVGAPAEQPAPVGDPLPPGALCRIGTIRWRQPAGFTGLTLPATGDVLFSAHADDRLRVWDRRSGRATRAISALETVHAFDVTRDACRLAFGHERAVVIWELATNRHPRRTSTPAPVKHLAFSPDGTRLAFSTWRGDIGLIDTRDGALLGAARDPHAAGPVLFAPDGRSLLTGGGGGTLARRSLPALEVVQSLGAEPLPLLRAALSPDGRRIATWDGDRLCTWDGPSGTRLHARDLRQVAALAFVGDGRAFVETDGIALRVRDADTGGVLSETAAPPCLEALAASPDGGTVATGMLDGAVRLWTYSDGRLTTEEDAHGAAIREVRWSPDGLRLATAANDHTVRLSDAATGRKLASWSQETGPILPSLDGRTREAPLTPIERRALLLTEDARTLVIKDAEPSQIRLVDRATGVTGGTAPCRGGTLAGIAASADASTVAWIVHLYAGKSLVGPSEVWVWRPAQGVPRRVWANGALIHALALSRDGTLLALRSADGLEVLDSAAATLRRTLTAPDGHVSALAFSGDARLLAGNAGRDVLLWDVEKDGVRRFAGHGAPVTALAFSPDGRRLASGSRDSTVLVWPSAE